MYALLVGKCVCRTFWFTVRTFRLIVQGQDRIFVLLIYPPIKCYQILLHKERSSTSLGALA